MMQTLGHVSGQVRSGQGGTAAEIARTGRLNDAGSSRQPTRSEAAGTAHAQLATPTNHSSIRMTKAARRHRQHPPSTATYSGVLG